MPPNYTSIEYGDTSYNPITGCLNGCPYCFARLMAKRFGGHDGDDKEPAPTEPVVLKEPLKLTQKSGRVITAPYPYGFHPTLYEYRLGVDLPQVRAKTTLVGFTGDLFGDWVPDDWIDRVFQSLEDKPGRFLFLTKNPSRYEKLAADGRLPAKENWWYGSTVTVPEDPMFLNVDYHTWINVEPIMAPFPAPSRLTLLTVGWVVFGAETGMRRNSRVVVPERSWLEDAVSTFERVGVPVFMKRSLRGLWPEGLLRQTPWEGQE